MWSLLVTAIFYLLLSCFLWYRADWLSTVFVRNASDPVPQMSRKSVVSTGVGLIGVLVLARELPDAVHKAFFLLDSRRQMGTRISDISAVVVPTLMTILALVLITKNLQWSEMFNYSFKTSTDEDQSGR